MSTPTKDQIKALEQSRQRLVQLTHSLASLIGSLNQSDPLPSWPSLQSQATILSNNLLSISEHLSENQPLLSSLVAYPGPDFPGRTQAPTLEQLLRTKLDPRVEDWVARGRRRAVPDTNTNSNDNGNNDGNENDNDHDLSEHDLAELWHWAPVEANREARQRDWGGDYTLEEREGGVANVVTGLRRVLDDGEDDMGSTSGSSEGEGNEGQGEEEEMEVVGVRMRPGAGLLPVVVGLSLILLLGARMVMAPVVPLEGILRFMTTGAQPSQR
ncbi:putative RNA polymerase II mediator complex component Med8 [Aspergillus campestris IBT 28561]|uniref:Mediator of RNA polymerase II transcription subunit 8 n=1 Tax=Aspergillus campestris (strain IBT 28561) TaxID=1392248 RepID=A0A2I1CWR0_ASPC2|nr:putative RNA polymerase II mediator complex component Med8 [Aspergillus campestris IBT 28561]PKY02062.1 putative RNA polymerase II mediator complex component Med8 [Aspergillus campestris IBT 28561]